MDKKILILLVILFPGLCLAALCPASKAQLTAEKWKTVFEESPEANFSKFKAAVWRPDGLYCVYQDSQNAAKNSVFKKGDYAARPTNQDLWKKTADGIVCKSSSIKTCSFAVYK